MLNGLSNRQKYMHEYAQKNRSLFNNHAVKTRQRLKHEIFAAYSVGSISCRKCGESDIDVLELDHINDDGSKQRRKDGTRLTGEHLYRYLRQQHYPLGYQVLCANCNLKKQIQRSRKNRQEKNDHIELLRA